MAVSVEEEPAVFYKLLSMEFVSSCRLSSDAVSKPPQAILSVGLRFHQ